MATAPLDPEVVAEQLSDTNPHTDDRRQHKRHPANWPAICFIDELEKWDVTIVDASEGGFGLSGFIPVSVNSRFWISMYGIDTFPCQLIWKHGEHSGVQLLNHDESITDVAADHLANVLSLLRKR